MSEPPHEIRQWIQDLISRSAKDQIDNLQRFEELIRRVSSGDINQESVRNEYLRFARDESTRYINDLTRVGLSFYNTLLELNRQYNDRFFQHAFREDQVYPGHPGAARTEPKIVEMVLHGIVGKHAERSFVIENQRDQDISVSFLVSEFTREDGSTSFRPPLQLAPSRFNLRAGQERMVNLKVPLYPELFDAGQAYHALVVVSGFENLQLRLVVRVDDTPESRKSAQTEEPAVTFAKTFLPVDKIEPPVEPDDLTVILGIGPAYQDRLRDVGVGSYEKLAAIQPKEIGKQLGSQIAARSERYQWQDQAGLAAVGDWDGLEALRKNLGS
jgi:predicted flap endonuclease-1-like 5' DNA nuclease